MKTLCLLVALLCLHAALAGQGSQEQIETACEYPHKLTLISSPNSVMIDSDNCNEHVGKAEWVKEPKVMFAEAEPGKTYTLLNVDPDPAGYKNGQYYLHWMVSNIKGEDFAKGDLSKADHLQEYLRPMPPAGTGDHRYMFLAFEQKEEGEKLENPTGRSRFEMAPWIQRQDGLNGPVAGIQYRTTF